MWQLISPRAPKSLEERPLALSRICQCVVLTNEMPNRLTGICGMF